MPRDLARNAKSVSVAALLCLLSGTAACGEESTNRDYPPDAGSDSGVIQTPADDDDTWPPPTKNPSEVETEWAQIRIDDDHYFAYTDSVQYVLQEERGGLLTVYGFDSEGRSLVIEVYQPNSWPRNSEFALSDAVRDLPRTSRIFLEDEDRSNRWASIDGRVFDIERASDGLTIAGEFEATLASRSGDEETREITGAFRGGFSLDCQHRVSDSSWEYDWEFDSEFCSQYAQFRGELSEQ